jgi:hypothetical protein
MPKTKGKTHKCSLQSLKTKMPPPCKNVRSETQLQHQARADGQVQHCLQEEQYKQWVHYAAQKGSNQSRGAEGQAGCAAGKEKGETDGVFKVNLANNNTTIPCNIIKTNSFMEDKLEPKKQNRVNKVSACQPNSLNPVNYHKKGKIIKKLVLPK